MASGKLNWERVCYAIHLEAIYQRGPRAWITRLWVAENNFIACGFASDWNRAKAA